MALTVTASLIGVFSPRTVQVVVSGMTIGATYAVVGNWSGGSWPVRGGTGTAEDTQLVLSDIATPINTPITYTITHNGQEATSGAVTAAYGRRYVLQSLSGDFSVEFDMVRNGAPQRLLMRQSSFMIPGRGRPVVRYDVAGGESGQLLADTEEVNTRPLRALLKTGAPLLLRTDGAILDLEPVTFLSVTGASSALLGMTRRRWELDYQVIDDPEPDTLVGLPPWDDFDGVYASLTWDDFDTEWSGATWDEFDTYDWASRA